MIEFNQLSRWAASPGYLWAGLVAVIIVVALSAACASQQVTAAEPAGPPVTYADGIETATPEPAPPPGPEPVQPPSAPEVQPEAHEAQAMAATPFQNTGAPPAPSQLEEECVERGLEPLPSPGSPGVQGFWGSFRDPFPPAPVWNPPGPKRVWLQAGHWRNNEVPRELGRLIGSGTSGGGRAEWEVNLDIAQRAAAVLESYGVQVDILPATVPPGYRAHAFISIHADGDLSGALSGYKVARAGFSPIPETDDVLVDALYAEYGPATGLRRDDPHVSLRMRYYYAFNTRRYCHAIAYGVPAAIIETGFLTNVSDRALLLGQPDLAAEGVARGVLSFLGIREPDASQVPIRP
ncbi:MAG: N-acetylmuramoyl-L-alanine amidase [Dehalococcoidia bacterium]|nr:N-acetylmuramoyl-L-alanine amidase [Dehalococcoidia bacterium]